jgi:hypothetical protein
MFRLFSDEVALAKTPTQQTVAQGVLDNIQAQEQSVANDSPSTDKIETSKRRVRPFAFTTEQLDQEIEEGMSLRTWLFRKRDPLLGSLKEARSKQFMVAALPYMNQDERSYWQSLYSELFIDALMEYNIYCILDRKQKIAAAEEKLNQLKSKLQKIDFFHQADAHFKSPILSSGDPSWTPVGYLGFSFGKWLIEQKDTAQVAPGRAFIEWLSELNWHRLYWVWAGGSGGLLGSTLDLEFFQQFSQTAEASRKLEAPGDICGYASWVLYAIRFTLESFFLLKHTVDNPFMTEEEKKLSFGDRLAYQWQQRKYSILNDLIWGWVNASSLYWYTSKISPAMGAVGGMLNIILMLFDVTMARLALIEGQQKFETTHKALSQKLEQVNAELQKILELSEFDDFDALLANLKAEQAVKERVRQLLRLQSGLQQELDTLTFNWHYDKQKLQVTLSTAILFTFAMALMFAPIFPVMFPVLVLSAAAIANIVFVGCVLSVILTAYESFKQYQLDIEKTQKIISGIQQKKQAIEQKYQLYSAKESELGEADRNELRMMVLEYKRLMAEEQYQKAQISYIRQQQVHSLITQFTFPVVVLASLFLATPLTIAVIASFIALALATRALVEKFKPKEVDPDVIMLSETEHNDPASFFEALKNESGTKVNPSSIDEQNESEIKLAEQLKAGSVIDESDGAIYVKANSTPALGRYGLFSTVESFVPQNGVIENTPMIASMS